MGMEGYVPDVWPDGRFIVYWPYPLEELLSRKNSAQWSADL
jgi:hypothetical protein